MYQKKPFIVDEKPGNKYYCACGESSSRPYCDGSHSKKATGKFPSKVLIEENKKVAVCGCGQSSSFPFCDGTHLKP